MKKKSTETADIAMDIMYELRSIRCVMVRSDIGFEINKEQ